MIAAIVNAVIPPVELPAELALEWADWADVERAVQAGVPHLYDMVVRQNYLAYHPTMDFTPRSAETCTWWCG